jgi:hypothetical protein
VIFSHEGKERECMLARKTDDGKLRPIGEDQRFAEAARALSDLNSEVAALQATV